MDTTRSEEFEDAIRADPENIDLRLIAADWYEERGDDRAEFIRVQLALSKLPRQHVWRREMKVRERELLQLNGKQWNAPIHRRVNHTTLKGRVHRRRGLLRGWYFHRGFVEELSVDAATLVAEADTLFQIGPIQVLRLWNATLPLMLQIVDSEGFRQIRSLDLQHNQLGDFAVQRMLTSGCLGSLTSLNLAHNDLTDDTIETLNQVDLSQLQRLVLSQNQMTTQELYALYGRLGDVVQHENGDPIVPAFREKSAPTSDTNYRDALDDDLETVSYNDNVLYEDGHIEQEYVPSINDLYHGSDNYEEPPVVRPHEDDEDEFAEPVGWDDEEVDPWADDDENW